MHPSSRASSAASGLCSYPAPTPLTSCAKQGILYLLEGGFIGEAEVVEPESPHDSEWQVSM